MNNLQNLEAEKYILGSLLSGSKKIDLIAQKLKKSSFYWEKHSVIYDAIINLYKNEVISDIITVSDYLEKNNNLEFIGGSSYLAELCKNHTTDSQVEHYAEIVLEKGSLRMFYEFFGKEYEKINLGKIIDKKTVCEDIEKILGTIDDDNEKRTSIDEILDDYTASQEAYSLKKADGELSIGIPCGYGFIDAAIDGYREEHLWTITAFTSVGKCHGLGTKILMYDGSIKKIENIIVGDKVMGQDSKPRNVLSICGGKDNMYKIKPYYGSDFVVNSQHILSVKRTGMSGDKIWTNKKGEITNISVENYLKSSNGFKHRSKLYRKPIEFKEKKLLIDPYFLGVWLGDGDAKSVRITNPDNEVELDLKKYAKKLKMKLHVNNNGLCKTLSITRKNKKLTRSEDSLQGTLNKLNLLKNKHIPNIYKINSRKNRLELLAGLIDSDGNASGNYAYEYSTIDEYIANDVEFVALSLGFRVTKKIRKSITNFSNGKVCKSYRIYIGGPVWKIPIRIKRKKIKKFSSTRNHLTTGFKVESLGIGEYRGFTLDGDNLYLLDNFIVNHNSSMMCNLIKNLLDKNKKVVVFSLEMSKEDIVGKLLAIETSLSPIQIKKGLTDNEIYHLQSMAKTKLREKEMKIYSECFDVDKIIATMKVENFKKQVDVFFLDYIQNVSGQARDEYTLLTNAIKKIQNSTRKLKTTTVILSQISNEDNKNGNMLNVSGKGSGAIKAASDLFIYLKREGSEEDIIEKYRTGEDIPLIAIINKNRHGRIGSGKLNLKQLTGEMYEPYQ
jgi:replicative DNA helicase